MNTVLDLLGRYKYIAMFAVLLACGLGLPLPEEVTLISSGLAVGWEQADFLLASLVCVAGILAGDAIVFGIGRMVGPHLLSSRVMRFILPERRQKRVAKFFGKHGAKTVFFARFFAGLRIGVYFYAGQHGMKWWRFLLFDLMGAVISGPTSIWVGKFAASRIADPHEARWFATHLIHKGQHWLYTGVGLLVVAMLINTLYNRRRDRLLASRGTGKQPVVVPSPVIVVPSLSVPAANSDDMSMPVASLARPATSTTSSTQDTQ